MNFKKYAYGTFTLLLFCRCKCDKSYIYKDEEEKGYYTQNHYKLDIIELFNNNIQILTPDAVLEFIEKLKNGIPRWRATGQEQEPYDLWKNFYNQEIEERIVKQLKKEGNDTTLLEDYYEKLGKLIREATEKNANELIKAIKKLEDNHTLIEALKASIAARYNNPGTIYISEAILAYQEFLNFVLNNPNKNNTLRLKIKKAHANLLQWKKNGYPSGAALWKAIQYDHREALKGSKLYGYKENKQVIAQLLTRIDQLADSPFRITYKDLLSEFPHGIKQLKDILSEVGLEEKGNIKLLKTYVDLVSSLYIGWIN